MEEEINYMEKKFNGCYRSQHDPNELKWSSYCKKNNIQQIYTYKKENIITKIINKILNR
jgi:hypothetical protein